MNSLLPGAQTKANFEQQTKRQTIFVDFQSKTILGVKEISPAMPFPQSDLKEFLSVIAVALALALMIGSLAGSLIISRHTILPQVVNLTLADGTKVACMEPQVTPCGMSYSQCEDGQSRQCLTNVAQH